MALAARHSQRAALQAQAVGHRDAAASRRWGRWRGAPADTGAKIPFNLPIRAPVIVQPAPVIVAPQPVIVQRAPVMVIEPPVVVTEPRVVYGYPSYRGYYRHWKHHHHDRD